MANKVKEGEFSSKISSIINSAPDFGEEEDDLTRVEDLRGEEPHSDSGDELNLAQFRKINIELLDAQDDKYAGFRASRKDFDEEKAFGSESENGSDGELDTGSVDDDDSETVEEAESESEDEEDSGEEAGFVEMSAKVASDIEKGHAIRNQLNLWDSLLESRIKFQKCLTAANKLPVKENMARFRSAGGEEFENAEKTCQGSVNKVLTAFLDLQKLCLDVNTKTFGEPVGKRALEDPMDDSDEPERKRRKLSVADEIRQLHESLIPFRNETIQKWNDKTRAGHMTGRDFTAFEQSTLKQIEIVLGDRQRLLKRTRTKRTNYRVLGQADDEPAPKLPKIDDEHCEIFDDDDFYHQLLRELLERKANDVTDPVQLSRQWIELQKARSKMKKMVDQKASKGRKLRYDVHQKMVNFMMPVDNTSWTDEAKSELFSSIFGQKSA